MTHRITRTLFLPLLSLVSLFVAAEARAQIDLYDDSAAFDDAFGLLRDVDFEDNYSVTSSRITVRNPYALLSLGLFDSAAGTTDVTLGLGQGATIELPFRTRTLALDGSANPFQLRVTTFSDSVYLTPIDTFPITLYDASGIARVQFIGTDGHEQYDVNWNAGLWKATTYDENGEIVETTDFDELPADQYFVYGNPYKAYPEEGEWTSDSNLYKPTDIHGITLTEPYYGVVAYHMSAFEGRIDPDNPIGNLTMTLTPGAQIDFAEGTEGALLVLEGVMHRDTIFFDVTDYVGEIDTVMVTGWDLVYDSAQVVDQRMSHTEFGFGSPDGIRIIRYLGGWGYREYENGIDEELQLSEPYDVAVNLAAVHLAETPPTEIASIVAEVEDIGAAGFLDDSRTKGLTAMLDGAIDLAVNTDNDAAVEQLEAFANDVATLHIAGTLVDEEAALLRGRSEYVISRLATGTTGVDDPMNGAGGIRLMATALGEEAIAFDCATGGDQPLELRIVDLSGSTVRTFNADANGNARFVWDLRNESGIRVSKGTYLAMLSTPEGWTTATLGVLR